MSVTAAEGFVAGGMHCGVKRSRPDLALLVTDNGRPVPTAAVFTQNRFRAPPVEASLARLRASAGRAAGVVVNSGNANAGTGAAGLADAEAMCVAAAGTLGIASADMLVCSTGIIGEPLPIDRISAGIPRLAAQISREGGVDAAQAILTTDTVAKEALVHAGGFVVGGMAKGCGMIAPNMATMLAFLTTDAEAEPAQLRALLREAADATFNRVVVDGATSTNDTVMLFASGRRGPAPAGALEDAVHQVCADLAMQIARDAEGRTKVATVRVVGAASNAEANAVAKRIVGNQLIKCSWYGADPYWGRLLAEAGASGAAMEADRASVSYGEIVVARGGVGIDYDREAVARHMGGEALEILVDLGIGEGRGHAVGVDLGPGYIKENAGTS